MHRLSYLGVMGISVVPFASWLGGCAPSVDCEDLANCERSSGGPDAGPDSAMVDAAATPAEDAVDATTTDTTTAADVLRDGVDVESNCNSVLPPNESPCLNEKLAAFVSPAGDDQTGSAGHRNTAFKTIGAALRAVETGPKRIYLCDNAKDVYSEQLSIDAAAAPSLDGVSLYGGFECTNWTYATTRQAKINAPPIAVLPAGAHAPTSTALIVKGVVGGIKVADVELGVGNSILPGASSIGVIVDTSMNVVFERVRIMVGSGADGQAGTAGSDGMPSLPAGPAQAGTGATCPGVSSGQLGGAWPEPNACGSLGGNGGTASRGLAGSPGFAGIPGGSANGGPSGGGNGLPGANGSAGAPGAATAALGSFSNLGYTPAPAGGDGMDGTAGQGGGGGGASDATGSCIGASGGAGGMGGCGGKKAVGGGSGGASVGVLSWSSAVTLDHCELVVANGGAGGNGGKGGRGGSGQDGRAGGSGFSNDAGDAVGKGGLGGRGGDGGLGGSGAGGNGGPSYGIVYKGDSASKNGTVPPHGNGGTKGLGGSQLGGVPAPDGMVGPSGNELQVN